jgi:hypothetical protein
MECHQFLKKSINFSKNCIQADKMFNEIISNNVDDDGLLKIREKYGFDNINIDSLDLKPNKPVLLEFFAFKEEMEEDALDTQPAKKSKILTNF